MLDDASHGALINTLPLPPPALGVSQKKVGLECSMTRHTGTNKHPPSPRSRGLSEEGGVGVLDDASHGALINTLPLPPPALGVSQKKVGLECSMTRHTGTNKHPPSPRSRGLSEEGGVGVHDDASHGALINTLPLPPPALGVSQKKAGLECSMTPHTGH